MSMENSSLITVIYVKCQLSVHLGKYQDLSVESRVDFSKGKCGREIGGERGITYTQKDHFSSSETKEYNAKDIQMPSMSALCHSSSLIRSCFNLYVRRERKRSE